jgi:hypothetical protein
VEVFEESLAALRKRDPGDPVNQESSRTEKRVVSDEASLSGEAWRVPL